MGMMWALHLYLVDLYEQWDFIILNFSLIHSQRIVSDARGLHRDRNTPETFELHIVHQEISSFHQFVDLLQELFFLLPVLIGLIVICNTKHWTV